MKKFDQNGKKLKKNHMEKYDALMKIIKKQKEPNETISPDDFDLLENLLINNPDYIGKLLGDLRVTEELAIMACECLEMNTQYRNESFALKIIDLLRDEIDDKINEDVEGD